jgi:hypothetical protein
MGFQRYSVELLDRSDPSFYEIMLTNLRDAYAQATDAYVIAQIIAGGTVATATDADSAGIISFVSTEAPAAYTATKRTAKSFVGGTSIWSLLLGAKDTTGRPIYNASNPQNAGGAVGPQSLRGNVAGLDLYVSRSLSALTYTTGDGSMFVINPESYTWYESPRLQLRSDITATGQVSVAYYGYGALATKIANGSVHFNKN